MSASGIWQLCILGAMDSGGTGYFRPLISQRPDRRLLEIEAECPIEIATVWTANCWTYRAAHRALAALRARLNLPERGGWYLSLLEDQAGRRALREALGAALDASVGPGRWQIRAIDIAAARAGPQAFSRD